MNLLIRAGGRVLPTVVRRELSIQIAQVKSKERDPQTSGPICAKKGLPESLFVSRAEEVVLSLRSGQEDAEPHPAWHARARL